MRILLATAALTATNLLACATSTPPETTGGAGGTGGSGGATTTSATTSDGGGGTGGAGGGGAGGEGGSTTTSSSSSTSSSSTTSSSTTNDDCGNGAKDPGEQCDGNDYGGKTCASIGFSGGELQCNSFCAIVASGCTPPENCTNAQDDDQDGLPDCLDSDCSALPVCLDSCAAPIQVTLPSFNFSDTTGRPAVQSTSCSAASGSEIVYQLVAAETVDMTVTVWPFNFTDFVVSVRTACDDIATEIHCENKFGKDFNSEQFLLPIVQGQTYYVIVDGANTDDFGGFQINMEVPQPEFDFQCNNHFDDDFDGYLDCDDATACQGSTYCNPGSSFPGAQCFQNTECAANGGDPICLKPQEGFADGYCSEFCDLGNPVCAGDGICVDEATVVGQEISLSGICLDTCLSIADCRPGYDCVDRGLAQLVCLVAPENLCDDYQDNDIDKAIDCKDIDCQSEPTCTGGDKAAGQPCLSTGECFSNTSDPICLAESFFFWPGGYCSQFCDINADDCGGGAICTQGWVNIDAAVCLDTCINSNECRVGYSCLDIGYPKKVCVF